LVASSSWAYRSASLAVVLLCASCCLDAAWGTQPSPGPTPAGWEQWQPVTDQHDVRLSGRRVSVWEREVTVRELVQCLSQQSSIEFTAAADLLPLRVTVFTEDQTVSGVMLALGDLLDAYWAFPRGQAPESRSYCLTPHSGTTGSPEELVEEHDRRLELARAARVRPEREARLAVYLRALSLGPGQLLAHYEESDPWLCADLLSPAQRPMMEKIAALTEAEREALLRDGVLALPLRDVDPDLRQHLARWCKGEWGRPATLRLDPDPDRLERFSSPEERWDNGVLWLRWTGSALQLQLDLLPDVARYDADVIHLSNRSPYGARKALATLGYREATPEYREAAKAEAEAWARAHGVEGEELGGELPYSTAVAAPDDSDPRLARRIQISLPETSAASVAELLEQIARQCGLPLLGHNLPAQWSAMSPRDIPSGQTTPIALLNAMRKQRGGLLTWAFRGGCLVVSDAEYRLADASVVSQETLDRLGEVFRSGQSASLDAFAGLVAPLNELQMTALTAALPSAGELPLESIACYGRLSEDQRARLRADGGIPLNEFSAQQQRYVLRVAQRHRPWIQLSDLRSSVLRASPRRLSTGADGVSFIVDHTFADSLHDRDILFTLPLQIPAGGRGE